MFFTQEDFRKIQEWLQRNSVKDSEFQEAHSPLSGREEITVIQDNQNKKMNIKNFIEQLHLLGVYDFLNVSDFTDTYNITLDEAIALVPGKARRPGQVISFKSEEGKWEIYQFTGEVNQWNITDLWSDIGTFEVEDHSITLDKLSQEVVDAINAGGSGTGEILPESIDATKLTKDSVTTEKIRNEAVSFDKLNSYLKTAINKIPYSTDNLPEGENNKYFTEKRVLDIMSPLSHEIKEYEEFNYSGNTGADGAYLKSGVGDIQSVYSIPSKYPSDLKIVFHNGVGLEKILSNKKAFIAYSPSQLGLASMPNGSGYGSVQWWVVFPESEKYNKYEGEYPIYTSAQARADRLFINKTNGELYRYNSVTNEFKAI